MSFNKYEKSLLQLFSIAIIHVFYFSVLLEYGFFLENFRIRIREVLKQKVGGTQNQVG
jgi:hypothetical protein